MPTTHPRHTITETEEVARALDEAARHWPEEAAARRRLLLRLVAEGYRSIQERRHRLAEHRLAAIAQTSGLLTGTYPAGYLAELREEWPA